MPQNNTLSYRVTQLEKCYDNLNNKMDSVMTNHLPHLSNDIQSLRGDINSIRSEVRAYAVLNAAAIIIGLIVSRLFL